MGLVDIYYADRVGDLGVFIEHLTFNQGFNSQKSQFSIIYYLQKDLIVCAIIYSKQAK